MPSTFEWLTSSSLLGMDRHLFLQCGIEEAKLYNECVFTIGGGGGGGVLSGKAHRASKWPIVKILNYCFQKRDLHFTSH